MSVDKMRIAMRVTYATMYNAFANRDVGGLTSVVVIMTASKWGRVAVVLLEGGYVPIALVLRVQIEELCVLSTSISDAMRIKHCSTSFSNCVIHHVVGLCSFHFMFRVIN